MTRPSPQPRGPDHAGLEHADAHLDPELIELLGLLQANGDDPSLEADAYQGDAYTVSGRAHLAQCEPCRVALQACVDTLRLERAEIEAIVDTQVSDEALDRQRRGILERLAARRDGGRVLDFPARPARTARRDRPAVRWLAAAAAAGLFVGMLAGQRLQPMLTSPLFGPGHESGPRIAGRPTAWRESAATSADPVLVHAHDELFLSEMETVVNNRGAAQLRALDDLTPEPVVAAVTVAAPR
jgi:hypothetical protein